MDEIIDLIQKQNDILIIDSSFVEIKTGIEFKKGAALRIFIKKDGDTFFITDNKNTLRFMSTMYELTAQDVKKCISDVVNHYHFRIEKGEIKGEITSSNAKKRFNEFMICCETLANMYIFFDEPEEE